MNLVVQPIDLTSVLIAAVTVIGGGFFAWLSGKKSGAFAARIDATERRISQHAELASTAAAVAAKHADVAGQVVSSLRAPAMPPGIQVVLEQSGIQGVLEQYQSSVSMPPEALESDAPSSGPGPMSMRLPVNRPTPKDRGTR
jgi:hypothetical protein